MAAKKFKRSSQSFRHLFSRVRIERYAFGRIYEVLFCVVVALMLTSGFRLAQIWAGLRWLPKMQIQNLVPIMIFFGSFVSIFPISKLAWQLCLTMR